MCFAQTKDSRRKVNGSAVLPRNEKQCRLSFFVPSCPSGREGAFFGTHPWMSKEIHTEVKHAMPNAKVLAEKQAVVAELAEKMKNAQAGVLVDYKGITVDNDTKLRAELRKNGVEYAVVKNTLTRFAAKQVGFDELSDVLNGTTALALSMDDAIAPARVIVDFMKKNPKVPFQVKAGFVEGKIVDEDTIKQLGELPGKEMLVAMVLGTLNAPIAALARAINAIAEQKGAPAAAEAPAAE